MDNLLSAVVVLKKNIMYLRDAASTILN